MWEQDLVGTLAFGTIGIVLVIALVLYLRFMRKPQNRHPMAGKHERNLNEIRREATVDKAPADREIK